MKIPGRRLSPMPVTIYTRRGCPLCDEGIAIARSVFGDRISLVDVDLDLDLLERFDTRVPVIAADDGTVIDEGIIDASLLREYASQNR